MITETGTPAPFTDEEITLLKARAKFARAAANAAAVVSEAADAELVAAYVANGTAPSRRKAKVTL